MALPPVTVGALGAVMAATVAMWATGVVIGEVPANGSAVSFLAMESVLPDGG